MTNPILRLGARMKLFALSLSMNDFVLLFFRFWVAKVFYQSGRSKVDGSFLSPSDMTIMLFEEEYVLPFVDPSVAAYLALYGETFFPIMLYLGLGTRLGAIGLLGMTLVIQLFVYPGYFPEHMTWIAALLPLAVMGGGHLSLDRPLLTRASRMR